MSAPRPSDSSDRPSPGGGRPTEVACWIGPGGDTIAARLSGDLADEVERTWGWRITAVGGERKAAASTWASRTSAAEVGTLRELARTGAGTLVILGREVPADDDLRAALDQDRCVVLTAPFTGPVSVDGALRLGERLPRLLAIPRFRLSAAFADAQPLLDEFREDAPPIALAVRMRCFPHEATQHGVEGMLADACDLVSDQLGAIESVTAAGRSPESGASPRLLSFVARSVDGAIATVDLADGGGWWRELELLGPAGRLRITDGLVERWGAGGTVSERQETTTPPVQVANGAVGATLESLRRIARARLVRDDPARCLGALALADAARLSLRTGNAEAPARIRELAGKP